MNVFQKTIRHPVSCSGIGLHTGLKSEVTFAPASENMGIFFILSDDTHSYEIPARVEWVKDSIRGTTLEKEGVTIHTVEHILAAIYGLGIDNIQIELSAKEPPIMDGSAREFVQLLQKAGMITQKAPKNYTVIQEEMIYTDSETGAVIKALPKESFTVRCSIHYGFNLIGDQAITMKSLDDFPNQIAPARTFCLLSEVERLYQIGLAKGGNLGNTIVFIDRDIEKVNVKFLKENFGISQEAVIHSDGTLNGVKLRFEDEPVRHKALDLIGDFALIGSSIKGHIIAEQSGHKGNIEMVKRIKEKYH